MTHSSPSSFEKIVSLAISVSKQYNM
ncbi:hypothetical protein Zm00014a_009766 [Zea mays]|uniref:Uncharacterized protein n=1 Tax=Zea mays TaxID=4577 RepID=A0A3L6D8P8_MAIZE|nr:hypothetical protein Zm00014a_009766 [Zea mays]